MALSGGCGRVQICEMAPPTQGRVGIDRRHGQQGDTQALCRCDDRTGAVLRAAGGTEHCGAQSAVRELLQAGAEAGRAWRRSGRQGVGNRPQPAGDQHTRLCRLGRCGGLRSASRSALRRLESHGGDAQQPERECSLDAGRCPARHPDIRAPTGTCVRHAIGGQYGGHAGLAAATLERAAT